MSADRMPNGAPDPIVVRALRADLVESEHRGAFAVVREGEALALVGDTDRPHYPRSSAKPFQALATLGILDAAGFATSASERAVIASSHAGEPLHVDLVRGLLARADLSPAALRCGVHPPTAEAAAAALARAGEAPTALHHNCSGKHAGMLIASRLRGWDLATYREPNHPIQRECRTILALFAGLDVEAVGYGIDGCGVPAFHLPLASMARAFARLGRPGSVPGVCPQTWRALIDAIAGEPASFGGTGRLATRLITITEGRVLAKEGAEGYLGIAVPTQGLGIALKILDGASRAVAPLAAALALRFVEGLGAPARRELEAMARAPIANFSGTRVGGLEATID